MTQPRRENLASGYEKQPDGSFSKPKQTTNPSPISSKLVVRHENHTSLPHSQPQQAVRHDSLGAAPREEAHPSRVTVRLVSYRKRLLDPDNLAGGAKYFIDALRYEGLIPGDAPDQIDLQISQVKCKDERTEIEIL